MDRDKMSDKRKEDANLKIKKEGCSLETRGKTDSMKLSK